MFLFVTTYKLLIYSKLLVLHFYGSCRNKIRKMRYNCYFLSSNNMRISLRLLQLVLGILLFSCRLSSNVRGF